jgi:DNA-directed RNA polymerase specialized sigma24 family protein
MKTHRHDPMKSTATRLDRIAVMHREHARELERRVARRARAEPQTIEDACSFAWMQLITHPSIDVDGPSYGALAWITRAAVHEAWRLQSRRTRDELLDEVALKRELRQREQTAPGADQLAAQRARLDLLAQIPPRPRRFLVRQALGHSRREIAADETVSLRTTDKQIARARRLLRALDATEATPCPSRGCTSVGASRTPAASAVSA